MNTVRTYIILLVVLIAFAAAPRPLAAAITTNGIGIYTGIAPNMGGSMHSYVQQQHFNTRNGIHDINRVQDGIDTAKIERPMGVTVGIDWKIIIEEYFFFRAAANYSKSVVGGSGTTAWTDNGGISYYALDCRYSVATFDVPLLAGFTIKFWDDVRFYVGGGAAFASGMYDNEFSSEDHPDPFTRKGQFRGTGFPLVAYAHGEYYFTTRYAISATVLYYGGSTPLLRDGIHADTEGLNGKGAYDYARIDFTGYRFAFGITFYFGSDQ